MNRIATALTSVMLMATVVATAMPAAAAPAPGNVPLRFGMDAAAIDDLDAQGVPLDYGTFWVGPWTLKHGWGGPDGEMASMHADGVTPAIHLYYWGDDISQDCIRNGCWSDLHDAWKDQAGWDRLADELVVHLEQELDGAPAVIFLETEFNKADVQYDEGLDARLAAKADEIKAGYPAAQVVLSLGNWNQPAWSTWDRAAAASDLIGLQGMRGSTRDSVQHYQDLYESTLAGAQHANDLFGKPVFIQDIALSSYPEPDYIDRQADGLHEFFAGADALREAGVVAMVYRSWTNSDHMDLANYYGEAERHWGLTYSDGVAKPAAQVWLDGVRAERGAHAEADAAPAAPLQASFQLSPNVNAWWVEARVSSQDTIVRVEASHDGGPWTNLPATSWGAWAKSFHVPPGGDMTLRATDASGRQAVSEPMPWLDAPPVAKIAYSTDALQVRLDASGSHDPDGDPWSASWDLGDGTLLDGTTVQHAYREAGTYTVTLRVAGGGAESIAQAKVTVQAPNQAPTAVIDHRITGGTVVFDASRSSDPDGDPLTYRWALGDGRTATGALTSADYAPGDHTVRLTVSDGKATATSQVAFTIVAPMQATFSVGPNVNPWWVEVRVAADRPLDGVQASHDGGPWVALERTAWGTWAKSFNAPPGTMSFRAVAGDQSVQSDPMVWLAPTEPAFKATFLPKTPDNRWWVEVEVEGNEPIVRLDARKDGGKWIRLDRTSWGTWAKSFDARGEIQFRATSADGDIVKSDPVRWG